MLKIEEEKKWHCHWKVSGLALLTKHRHQIRHRYFHSQRLHAGYTNWVYDANTCCNWEMYDSRECERSERKQHKKTNQENQTQLKEHHTNKTNTLCVVGIQRLWMGWQMLMWRSKVSSHMEKWKWKWKLAPKTIQITLCPFVYTMCAYQWMHLSIVWFGERLTLYLSFHQLHFYVHTHVFAVTSDMEAPCVLLPVFQVFSFTANKYHVCVTIKHRIKANAYCNMAIHLCEQTFENIISNAYSQNWKWI